MILQGLAAAPRPEDRSLVESFLGEKPGFLAAALQQIKTMLILSTVVTLGIGAVVLVTAARGQRRNPARRRRSLTTRQKRRAGRLVREEMHAYKRGRWQSRRQAVAVGLSRARRA